jgi:hypothetical protein
MDTFIAILLLSIYLGISSRIHGGGFLKELPKQVRNFLWALPFAWVTGIVLNIHYGLWIAITGSILVTALCMLGKTLGHGNGIDLGHFKPKKPVKYEPEKAEYPLLWLRGRIHDYWYDVILMAWFGLLSVLGASIAFGFVSIPAAIIIALGGLMKGVAYMIGWAVYDEGTGEGLEEFNEATEIGEFLTGVFAGLALGVAYLVAI